MEITTTLLANLDHLGNWGILTTGLDLKITGWNRWLEKHSAKPASEMMGQHLFEAYPELVDRSLKRYYEQALLGHAAVLSQRFHRYLLPMPPTVSNSDVLRMQQSARISPITQESKVCGTLTLIEDVTERVITEAELRKQAERLEEANRHKDEFLAMLAHELRNPLAPISNGIRVLEMVRGDSDEAIETREMISRQVAHMSRLIDDLLDVSRIVRGKVQLRKEKFDLLSLVRQVARDFEPILADSGLQLVVDVEEASCWVDGDAVRLAQVISNLLQNANKFTDKGGEVKLIAKSQPDLKKVLVQVTDTGIGMSIETVARVFDAFSQAENSLARSKGGLGLGLALVKGLVELHDGKVVASSEGIGMGSTFAVWIPTAREVDKPKSSVVERPTVGRQVERVLIIEDNRDTALTLQMLLRSLKLDVEVAFSGAEGLQIANQSPTDVVLCDIGLPIIDGYTVARQLRSHPATRGAFLIAQSGYGQPDDVRRAHEAGFDLHLIKPVDFQELKRILGC